MALEYIFHFLDAWAASPSHLNLSIQLVWDDLVHKLDVPFRWGKVTGPLSSAIATLLDWGFYPVAPFLWLDPEGRSWSVDPKAPNCVAAAREVLSHHFHKKIWATAAPANADPLGACPDIAPYLDLRNVFRKGSMQRHLYFLDAVFQGAMSTYCECHFHDKDGQVICNHCDLPIGLQSSWEHLCLHCSTVASWLESSPPRKAFADYLATAREEVGLDTIRNQFWLRGVMPLTPVDALSLNYAYHTSFPTGERLCVQGCFLGGDGSGGRYSRDPRARTCGFGLAVVSASVDYESAKLLGHVIGSTLGSKQFLVVRLLCCSML